MTKDIDARIARLLNQLEKPDLKESEIQQIKDKIKFLRSMEAQ